MLELGDRAEDLEEHPADGGRRVDALVEDDEVDAAGLELAGERDQVLKGAAEPVEFGDDKLVASTRGDEERPFELGAARQLAAGLIDVDLVAAGGGEGVALAVGVLVAGGDPRSRSALIERNANA